MTRYFAAVVLLVVYANGAAWAVRRAGAEYRATILARADRPPDVDLASTRPVEPAPAPAPRPKPGHVPVNPPPVAVAAAPRAPEPSKSPAPEAVPADEALARPAEPAQLVKAEAEARNAVNLKFWNQELMTRVWDVKPLTPKDEAELGQSLNWLVLKFHPKSGDSDAGQRLTELAQPYLAARVRKDVNYTFTLLDSDAKSAFSHPGGYVYVCRGLLDMIGEDEDYVLEFVLAHEIAHVDLRHALDCLNVATMKPHKLGTLQYFMAFIFPLGYMERHDYEADKWAYTKMTTLGRTPREKLAFLRRWKDYAKSEGFAGERRVPKPSDGLTPFEYHLRAHPPVFERLKRLEALAIPGAGAKPVAAAAPAR